MTAVSPGIPAATGDPQQPAHGFNAELSLMFFDEDILHFRLQAKYVAHFGEWSVPHPVLPVDASDWRSQQTPPVRVQKKIADVAVFFTS
jgi:hypothetical protein